MKRRQRVVAGVAMALLPMMAAAQQAGPPADAGDEGEDIVVNGRHLPQPGAVASTIPPELQYSPADIRALGVSSISDLLDELAPEIRSDRGRGGEAPVVLLNGRRISGFSEIRDLPTEAIQRVDILPEEVALSYGYSANQRVVNIVLRRRFRSLTGQADAATSTDSGGTNGTGDAGLVRIHGDNRFNLDLKYKQADRLTESQRDLTSSARSSRPYDSIGNVTAANGVGEIDPALSALAGQPVTVAGVPAGGGTPTLAGFAGTANSPNVTDVSPYRTLVPASRDVTFNSVYARPIGKRVTATLNGTLDYSETTAWRGLPGAALAVPAGNPFSPFSDPVLVDRYLGTDPLTQRGSTLTSHIGLGLNADAGKWRLSFTAGWDHGDSITDTRSGRDVSALQAAINAGDASVNPFGALPAGLIGGWTGSHARSVTDTGNAQFVANGPLVAVPAGPLSGSVKVGWTGSSLSSSATRFGIVQHTDLGRRDLSGQISFDLPIASRAKHFLSAIGTLSANVNLAADHYSDFGTQTTLGYGLNWSPRDGISLVASTTHDHTIPSTEQLAGPTVVSPEVRLYDYATGRTVDVIETTGANPGLTADSRHVDKLGLTLKPFKATDLTLSANYIRSTIRNAIASFPTPTAAIELAFPDRFTRDEEGDLESIDVRPVNFARERREELRWGVNYTRKLKSSAKLFDAYRALRQQREAAGLGFGGPGGPSGGDRRPGDGATSEGGLGGGDFNAGGRPGGGFGGRGGGGGFGGRGGAAQGGRLQLSVYHTWFFRDDILVRPGGPLLDLLDGGTIGSGGGQPRHELEFQLGYSNNGIGARLTGQWQSATSISGAPGATAGDLHFSPLATANFRLFMDLGQQPSLVKHRWARGMRLTLAVTNITNSRQRVRDATGATPLIYQPAYLDPLGRTIRVSIRKLLF